MSTTLASVPAFVLCIVIVGGAIALALLGMVWVRRSVDAETLEAHQEVAGFIISVVGTIYAVVLALVVVAVWEQFEDARTTAEREANAVANLYHLARGLPAKDQHAFQEKVKTYARVVVDEEWRLMQRGQASDRAWDAFHDLWPTLTASEPQSMRESAIHQEALERMNELADARRVRLLSSHTEIPRVLWTVLIGGAITTIGFTYFFGVSRLAAQALMTVALSGTIALVLFVIVVIDLPFRRDVGVSPEALQQVLTTIERIERR
jgi:hypothetical protein